MKVCTFLFLYHREDPVNEDVLRSEDIFPSPRGHFHDFISGLLSLSLAYISVSSWGQACS